MELFCKNELELKNIILSLIKDLNGTNGISMEYARCDNAGENEDCERIWKQERMSIQF